MMKTNEELHELMKESIEALHNVFVGNGKLRVPETDKIMEMVYCYFFTNSMSSIPRNLREIYIKDRLGIHGEMLTCTVNEVLSMVNKEEEREQASNDFETIH